MGARLPNGAPIELGIGDLRRFATEELRELAAPIVIVDKRTDDKLAAVVPYQWYLDVQATLAGLAGFRETK